MFSRTYSSTSGSPARSSTRSTNGSRSSLGQRVEMADETHGLDERARILGRHRLGLEPARHVGEPGALQPRSRLGVGRVVPRALPVGEVRRERLLPRDLDRQASGTRRCCPRPPHWATSWPPGLSVRCSAANSASWSWIQWKVAFEKIASTGSGRSSSTRSWHRTRWRGRRAPRAACATIDGATSTAYTRPRGTRSASSAVTRPEPQPASSTTSSPDSASRSSCSRAHASCGSETRSYVAASQSRDAPDAHAAAPS